MIGFLGPECYTCRSCADISLSCCDRQTAYSASNSVPHCQGLFSRFTSFSFWCEGRVSVFRQTSSFLLISRNVRLSSNENVIKEMFDNLHECRSRKEREDGLFRIGVFHCKEPRLLLRKINLSSLWLPLNKLGEIEGKRLLEKSILVRFSSLWNVFSLIFSILQY